MKMSARKYGYIGFVMIMTAAFAARAYGLDFPQYHWDEILDFNNVFSASHNRLALLNYGHGSFHPYLILIVWKLYLLFIGAGTTTESLLSAFFEDSQPFLVLARGWMAVISTASVAMVFILGKRLYNTRVGWLSAILLSGTFLYAAESHYASSVHVLSTFFIILTLYFCHRILEKGDLQAYIFAGVSFGLATAAQYSMIIAFAPILYAHFKHIYNQDTTGKFLARQNNRLIIVSGSAAAVTFFCVTPYAALDAQRFFLEMQQILQNVTHVWIDSDGQPAWLFYFTEHLNNGMGTLLALTSMAGITYAILRRSQSDILLVVFLVVSYVSLVRGANFARYLIPSLPSLVILAGLLLDSSLHRLDTKLSKTGMYLLSAVMLAGLLAQPITNIIRFNYWITQPDTRQIASQWISSNIPPGSRVVIEGAGVLGPNIPTDQKELEKLISIQAKGSLGEIYTKALLASQQSDAGYHVLSVFRLDQRHKSGQLIDTITSASYFHELGYDYLITSSWMQRDAADAYSAQFQESLDQYYEEIKVFKPTIYFLFDPYAWRMDYQALSRVAPDRPGIGGPILTIYKRQEAP